MSDRLLDLRRLAAALDMPESDFRREYGVFEQVELFHGYEPLAHAACGDQGHPIQVLLGLDDQDRVWVAQPRIVFDVGSSRF